ncbi:hypothetical protein ACFLUH_03345 [Chloroflexota bacterium]
MWKWKLLFGIGITLLCVTAIAMVAYPKNVVSTGEYEEINDGNTVRPETEVIPDEGNPDWVKTFQQDGAGFFIVGLIIIGVGASKIWRME